MKNEPENPAPLLNNSKKTNPGNILPEPGDYLPEPADNLTALILTDPAAQTLDFLSASA